MMANVLDIKQNRLMQVEVVATSHELAILNIVAEFGGGVSLNINRDIAEFMIQQLQAFLDPSKAPIEN